MLRVLPRSTADIATFTSFTAQHALGIVCVWYLGVCMRVCVRVSAYACEYVRARAPVHASAPVCAHIVRAPVYGSNF